MLTWYSSQYSDLMVNFFLSIVNNKHLIIQYYIYLNVNDHQILLNACLSQGSFQFHILHVTEWNSGEHIFDKAVEPFAVGKRQLGESV